MNYTSDADMLRRHPCGAGDGNEESTIDPGCVVHAPDGGARSGCGHGSGDRDEGRESVRPLGAVHGSARVSDPLTSLAVLFDACREGPPDDSPAYVSAMQRATEVLRAEIAAAQEKT